jgi:hypothetical protein
MLGSASQSAPSSSSVSNFMVDNYGSYGLQSCNPINSTFVSGSQPIHSEGVAAFNFATDGSTYRENGMSLDVGRLLQKGPRRDEEALSTILLSLKATGSDQDDNADDDILEVSHPHSYYANYIIALCEILIFSFLLTYLVV